MPHTAKTQTNRGRQTVHDVELTAQRFLSVLEREAGRALSALFRQLNFASRHEVHGLLRRVAHLEQRLTPSGRPVDCALGHSMNESVPLGPRAQAASIRRHAELLWDEV